MKLTSTLNLALSWVPSIYNRQVFIKFLLFWIFTSSFTTFQPILRRLTKQKDTNIKTAKHIKLLVVLHTHVLALEFRYI